MFFELRQYRIKGGQRKAFVKHMEEEVIPFQIEKGMVVVGSFIAREEDDLEDELSDLKVYRVLSVSLFLRFSDQSRFRGTSSGRGLRKANTLISWTSAELLPSASSPIGVAAVRQPEGPRPL